MCIYAAVGVFFPCDSSELLRINYSSWYEFDFKLGSAVVCGWGVSESVYGCVNVVQ